MPRAQNIAKTIMMLTALLLLAWPRYAHAQVNTGATPYRNSWHTYRVIVGDTGNDFEWDIVDVVATDTTHLDGSEAWCNIAALDGDSLDISIFFTDTVFDLGTEYGLLFRENEPAGTCIAARRFSINPVDNQLYYTLADNDTICKPQNGLVCSWDTTDIETYTTTFTYRVTMNKPDNFVLTGWSFDARITLDPSNHSFSSYTAEVVPVTEGTTVLTDDGAYAPTNDGWFHVALSEILQTPDTTELSVDIEVTLDGLLHEGDTVTLALENGQATSGVTGVITTYDNILVPMGSDREQIFVVNPLPDTRDIGPGTGETVWSTGSPLQYSTHDYVIEMGDMGNFATRSGWYIDTLNGGTVPFIPANYELTRSQSATSDTANITFNMGPGNYVLYFYETSLEGCTALREYPFTLGDPFDVDIADEANVCPDISDQFNTFDSVSVTTVDYVINLESDNYAANWGFDFALSCDLTFTGITLDGSTDISIVDIIGDGAVTYIPNADDTTGTVTVTYDNITPTTQFTIRVNYHSQFYDQYEITAAMSNITGSYGELDHNTAIDIEMGNDDSKNDDTVGTSGDADGDDQNNTVHYIYELPQTLALEGVD